MEFLRSKGAKAVVVACNTATGIAVDALRARYDVPIVAIEPAVKPAAAQTRSRVVGVLATTQTLAGQKFAKLVSTYAGDVEVLTQACPGLVEQVEAAEARVAVYTFARRAVSPSVARQGARTRSSWDARTIPFWVISFGRWRARRHRDRFGGASCPGAPSSSAGGWPAGAGRSPRIRNILDDRVTGHVRAVIARLWGSDVDVRPVPSVDPERRDRAPRS